MTQVRIGNERYERIESDDQHVRYKECAAPEPAKPANEQPKATRRSATRELFVIALIGLLMVTAVIMARVLAF